MRQPWAPPVWPLLSLSRAMYTKTRASYFSKRAGGTGGKADNARVAGGVSSKSEPGRNGGRPFRKILGAIPRYAGCFLRFGTPQNSYHHSSIANWLSII